jgi:lysophospholipase L1-like esterase
MNEHVFDASWGFGRYEPYIVWTRRPYHSEYTNVNKQGLRRTWNKKCDHPLEIHVYGGSTVWGSGVKDSQTIPSFLSRIVSEKTGACCRVTNFGEGGYVTSQDLIRFIKNIRSGNTPDVAVFYGGINDGMTAWQGLPPSFPHYYPVLVERMEPRNNTRNQLFKRFINSCCIYNRITSVVARHQRKLPAHTTLQDYARAFTANYSLAHQIAKANSVQALFFLQPCVFLIEKANTSRERRLIKGTRPVRQMLFKFYGLVKKEDMECELIDLSKTFDDWKQDVFLDQSSHLTPAGNKAIARKIYETYPRIFYPSKIH